MTYFVSSRMKNSTHSHSVLKTYLKKIFNEIISSWTTNHAAGCSYRLPRWPSVGWGRLWSSRDCQREPCGGIARPWSADRSRTRGPQIPQPTPAPGCVCAHRRYDMKWHMYKKKLVIQESWATAKMTARCALYIDTLKSFESPWVRPRLLFLKFFMGFCSDRSYECAYKIWSL